MVVAFSAMVYIDYKDDGEVFNGSVTPQEYIGATALGALLGLIAGLEFTITIPMLGFVNGGSAMSIGIVGTTTVSINGEQVIAGAAMVSTITIMNFINLQGTPNTKVESGGSFGEYDENGNLSYRVDTTGRPHYIKSVKKSCLPHIHKFTWRLINGVWRYIEEVLPYIL
ncbi:MAG: hypothetical protein V8R16_03830 [Bacilli bacterium]